MIDELRQWLAPHGLDDQSKLDDNDPLKPVVNAARYLRNNRSRMDYPCYRRLGLPVTSALMESLVKEVNYRVKGTEMFWNDPEGAEAILQVRAAALCDDDRLARYLDLRTMLAALKKCRERRGLSLTDAANRSGMDRAAISRLENGVYLNPTVDTLYRYAQAIGAEIRFSVHAS